MQVGPHGNPIWRKGVWTSGDISFAHKFEDQIRRTLRTSRKGHRLVVTEPHGELFWTQGTKQTRSDSAREKAEARAAARTEKRRAQRHRRSQKSGDYSSSSDESESLKSGKAAAMKIVDLLPTSSASAGAGTKVPVTPPAKATTPVAKAKSPAAAKGAKGEVPVVPQSHLMS